MTDTILPTRSVIRPPQIALTAALFLATSSGCVGGLAAFVPGRVAAKVPPAPVSEIMALWQPGEGKDPDGLPARGFAGQVFFFANGSKAPVLADGDVTFYVFDDQGTPDEQARPIHQFHFAADAWQTHHVKSGLGDSYQIFLPYTRAGRHHAVCSIRVKMQTEDGRSTLSEAANVVLSGERSETSDTSIDEPPSTTESSATAATLRRRDSAVRGAAAFSVSPGTSERSSTIDGIRQASFYTDTRPPAGESDRTEAGLRVYTIPLGRRPESDAEGRTRYRSHR